jgi:hypothetical protein
MAYLSFLAKSGKILYLIQGGILMWEKIQLAYDTIQQGKADRVDIKEFNIVVYKAGSIIRIDSKGVFTQ